MRFCRTIAAADEDAAVHLVTPMLARAKVEVGADRSCGGDFWLGEIAHHVYVGDTALHVAAAGHRPRVAQALIALGADVDARNRRGAAALHYAADGVPGSPTWNPTAQAETIIVLLRAGANPNAVDKSGVTALHRAVRTCCAAAAAALLTGGADPARPNRNASTPLRLATRATGRRGSGSAEAREQQREIVRLLTASDPG